MRASLFCALLGLLLTSAAAQADVVRLIDESKVECSTPCQRAAVVFIHGILGSKETWQNGTAFWPKLLATDPDIGDKVDVYRVDFDSYLFEPGPSLVAVLEQLQQKLDTLLTTKQYSKVFLIGHSLGGNIARAYLLHVKAKYGHRALSAFRVTYTLGTPMMGSSLATLASFASKNQQLRVLLPIKVNDFQQLLNMTLVSVNQKHEISHCPKTSLLAAYEEQSTTGVGLIVSEWSATKNADETHGFYRTHSSLVKPKDRTDPVYQWVSRSMEICIAGLGYCSELIGPQCGRIDGFWPEPKSEGIPELSPAARHSGP